MNITVPTSGVPFKNAVRHCVGTGSMALSLRENVQEHLKMVQADIGFSFVRGHGLFSEPMGIYQEYAVNGKKQVVYNFTYLDRVFDRYLENGIRPLIELGFMPAPLASGERTVFFWHGNVTPPRDMGAWCALVKNTLMHLIERYGAEEVRLWPIEIWNEPNIAPFWAGNMQDYFDLYEATAQTVKALDGALRVGGPAICGVDTERWLTSFFSYCETKGLPLDFVTRHCYTGGDPRRSGQYFYHDMARPTRMIEELRQTRAIMAQYKSVANLPLYITEFNTSYNSRCPVHDSAFSAPYIARILSEMGEYADSYAYWTFSDVFEEEGVPHSEFHGGFGLVSGSGVKKPTYYAFEFFARAGETLLYRDENLLVTKRKDGAYALIAWDYQDQTGSEANAPFAPRTVRLPALSERAVVIKRTVGEGASNPVQTWSDLGKPPTLSKEQRGILLRAGEPAQKTAPITNQDGVYTLELSLLPNQLALYEILPAPDHTDALAGYEPGQFYGLT